MVINILSAIFALGLGFGVAFWGGASLLNKSNNIGDSRGQSKDYTPGVKFSNIDDKLDSAEIHQGKYVQNHWPKKPEYPTAPRGKDMVKPPKE